MKEQDKLIEVLSKQYPGLNWACEKDSIKSECGKVGFSVSRTPTSEDKEVIQVGYTLRDNLHGEKEDAVRQFYIREGVELLPNVEILSDLNALEGLLLFRRTTGLLKG